MKLSSLLRMLIFIIIIINIGGLVTDPSSCLVCGSNGLKYLGIAEIISGMVSLGPISKIRNTEKF